MVMIGNYIFLKGWIVVVLMFSIYCDFEYWFDLEWFDFGRYV